uniref:Uncharacterized protein n=1 Tax=Meloidogyne hapla TaxID=6305 RepID=A0A1I8B8B0_MELHA
MDGYFKIARGQDECLIEIWGINFADPLISNNTLTNPGTLRASKRRQEKIEKRQKVYLNNQLSSSNKTFNKIRQTFNKKQNFCYPPSPISTSAYGTGGGTTTEDTGQESPSVDLYSRQFVSNKLPIKTSTQLISTNDSKGHFYTSINNSNNSTLNSEIKNLNISNSNKNKIKQSIQNINSQQNSQQLISIKSTKSFNEIKRRPDGTRYVTRRPVRSSDNSAFIKERRERSALRERHQSSALSTTTDDDGQNVIRQMMKEQRRKRKKNNEIKTKTLINNTQQQQIIYSNKQQKQNIFNIPKYFQQNNLQQKYHQSKQLFSFTSTTV